MAKPKRSPEAQVVGYFRSADLTEARMVLGIVRDIMKEREGPTERKKRSPAKAGPKPAKPLSVPVTRPEEDDVPF